MLELYRALVRLQLEYCVQFWSSHDRKDVIVLDEVQRRFIRILPGMEKLSYKEKLDRVGWFSLEQRRLKGDMFEVYKFKRGMDSVNREQLFPLVEASSMRGQSFSVR
eukprot:g30739.t1